MTGYNTIRVNFIGGIASPGELQKILAIAAEYDIKQVRFGLRQQMIMYLSYTHEKAFISKMNAAEIDFYVDENPHPNVISSYVSEEVFQRGNWLSEGIYKDILDAFDYNPSLKINISDSQQSFTPFFSGHINFISSEQPNFWHLYLREPKSNELITYDKLVFSNEIAKISKILDERISAGNTSFDGLPSIISVASEKKLKLPKFTLPYYEGFNRYGKKTWLGIYRRGEVFNISFLQDLCRLCLKTKIGEICLTPWKSIIIKNIEEVDRNDWSGLLAKHDINVRHAANELNWQIEDTSPDALKLKNKLVGHFNKKDLRTFGICLGIKTYPKTEVYASILVKQKRLKILPFIKLYDITYTTNYDPNGRKVAFFAKNIFAFSLPEELRKSVLKFNENIAYEIRFETSLQQEETSNAHTETLLHQCPYCFTIYDPAYGDEMNDISPGLNFENLQENYCCSVCDAPKSTFELNNVSKTIFN